MIKYNDKYTINNGLGTIVFTEAKQGTVNAEYHLNNGKDIGQINGTMSDNILKGTYHNKTKNITGLIEISFHENGFNAKWKQDLEPGPMRGKWTGTFGDSLKKNDIENKADSQRKVAIFAGQTDEETGEVISINQSEEKPYIIAIGFFDTHLQETENEWYGFVGYVITNTCDDVRTESVLFMDELGQTVSVHDMGGEAITEDGLDLVSEFKRFYPNEWIQIDQLLDEYFYSTDDDQDDETLYLTLTKDIPEELLMSFVYSGDWLDLEEVRRNNGSRIGLMFEL
jgi:hypothetical protein